MLGVFFVFAATAAAPRLGVGVTFGLVVTGQVITSMLFDHCRALNLTTYPMTGWRLLGAGLVIAGAVVLATTK